MTRPRKASDVGRRPRGAARPKKGSARPSASPSSAKEAGRAGEGAGGRLAREFVRGLSETERIALVVRNELFGGSWRSMREDLEARAAGRPYVFKLASRIEEDLRAVEKLSAFERRHRVNLSDYVEGGR